MAAGRSPFFGSLGEDSGDLGTPAVRQFQLSAANSQSVSLLSPLLPDWAHAPDSASSCALAADALLDLLNSSSLERSSVASSTGTAAQQPAALCSGSAADDLDHWLTSAAPSSLTGCPAGSDLARGLTYTALGSPARSPSRANNEDTCYALHSLTRAWSVPASPAVPILTGAPHISSPRPTVGSTSLNGPQASSPASSALERLPLPIPASSKVGLLAPSTTSGYGRSLLARAFSFGASAVQVASSIVSSLSLSRLPSVAEHPSAPSTGPDPSFAEIAAGFRNSLSGVLLHASEGSQHGSARSSFSGAPGQGWPSNTGAAAVDPVLVKRLQSHMLCVAEEAAAFTKPRRPLPAAPLEGVRAEDFNAFAAAMRHLVEHEQRMAALSLSGPSEVAVEPTVAGLEEIKRHEDLWPVCLHSVRHQHLRGYCESVAAFSAYLMPGWREALSEAYEVAQLLEQSLTASTAVTDGTAVAAGTAIAAGTTAAAAPAAAVVTSSSSGGGDPAARLPTSGSGVFSPAEETSPSSAAAATDASSPLTEAQAESSEQELTVRGGFAALAAAAAPQQPPWPSTSAPVPDAAVVTAPSISFVASASSATANSAAAFVAAVQDGGERLLRTNYVCAN